MRGGTAGWIAALLLAALLAAPGAAAATTEVAGERFADRIGADEAGLDLCSAHLFRWKRIVKAYVAALYLRDCSVLPERPQEMPQRLELAYQRGFSAPQFAEAADTVLERSFPPRVLDPLRERIARLHAAYRAVETGDRYALTWRPGVGTELALNGEPLVVVPGADFAAAYFAIWLGADPADKGLRDRLLTPR